MATIGGPNTEKDNLVFGYDTGYGVADNTTATRFYPGEPTTNSTILTGYGWNGDGSNQSFANKGATTITDNSLKYNGYDTVLWTPGSSLNCYLNGSSDLNLNDNSTIWTFSCYVKREDGAVISSLNVYLYYPNSDGSASGTIVDCGNGWYRVSRTRTGTSDNIGLAGFTGFSSGHKYYLSGVMLTKNNHTVPYINVQSSRSSTQSLIDLKRTKDTDVSNISFDSTGQPDFDGSNEYINLGNYDALKLGFDFSLEFVVKPEQDKWMYFFHKGYGANNALAWGRHSSGDDWFFSTYISGGYQNTYMGTATLNKYCHLVATYDGANLRLYENGILKATSAKTHQMMDTNTSAGIGGPDRYWNGKIPVAKVYSKVLTTEEVQQNYNAYKNRFDI